MSFSIAAAQSNSEKPADTAETGFLAAEKKDGFANEYRSAPPAEFALLLGPPLIDQAPCLCNLCSGHALRGFGIHDFGRFPLP